MFLSPSLLRRGKEDEQLRLIVLSVLCILLSANNRFELQYCNYSFGLVEESHCFFFLFVSQIPTLLLLSSDSTVGLSDGGCRVEESVHRERIQSSALRASRLGCGLCHNTSKQLSHTRCGWFIPKTGRGIF